MSNYTVTNINGTRINYGNTQWPVSSINISDPFGPRRLTENSNNYDFHRGLDFQDQEGVPVYAIADGTVNRVQADCTSCAFPNGGNVVVIKHSLPSGVNYVLNGQSFTEYYSIYSHLKDFKIDDVGTTLTTGTTITKGSRIGSLGATDANYPHLHLETRVGTTCSAESQQNSSSSCYQRFGSQVIDPSVHPLYFLNYVNDVYVENNAYDVCVAKAPNVKVKLESPRNELDFNEIEIISGGQSKKINFTTKAGINLSNIDQTPYDGVTIIPPDFNSSSPKYTIEFDFANFTNFDEITVRDIWGNGKKIVPRP
ncbi:hypothetical protein NUACC21_46780 [Scytonema sp. NUACC21]